MALFEYFPNYVWNLSLAMALESGGRIGEIIDMCAPLREAAAKGDDVGTPAFMREWVRMADTLAQLADEDLLKGRKFSAGEKLRRAALYYQVAERMQGRDHPHRAETYRKALDSFNAAMLYTQEPVEHVTIPYEGRRLSALFTRAPCAASPVVVYCNGLDSTKELLWLSFLPTALAKRGISSLCIDQPGTGEALRLHGLPATHEAERWASACVDWLEMQPDVNARRIGMTGISLGGYFAPRAVAFEPRFAAGAAWGANHDWAEVQLKRLRREGENPVPHYWNHVLWVFGAQSIDEFLVKAKGMTLDGVLERIQVPFLITHGERDRQISIEYAHRSFAGLVNCPARELKILTAREGGVEHVGADNMSFGRDYLADWFAEHLGGHIA
jgi:hypothetical protein